MRITDPFDQYDYLPCFSPRLAATLGKHCEGQAILLHQIEFWLAKPKVGKIVTKCVDKKNRIIQNRKWIRERLSDFEMQFPNISSSTLRRQLNKLINRDLIIATDSINRAKFDKTTWYTVNFDKLWKLFKTSRYTDKIGNFRKISRTPSSVRKAKQDMEKYQTGYIKASKFPPLRNCSKWSHDMVNMNNSTAQNEHMEVSKMSRPTVQNGHHYTLNIPKYLSKSSTTFTNSKSNSNSKIKNQNNINLNEENKKVQQPIRNSTDAKESIDAIDYADKLDKRAQFRFEKYDSSVYDIFSHFLTDEIPASLDGFARTWFRAYRVDIKLVNRAALRAHSSKPDITGNSFIKYTNGILRNWSSEGFHTYRHYKSAVQNKNIANGVRRGHYIKAAKFYSLKRRFGKFFKKLKHSHGLNQNSPQPKDDNGNASDLDRTAQVVHIQRTGNLDKMTKKDYWYARLICASNYIYCNRTGVKLSAVDPTKKSLDDFRAGAKVLKSDNFMYNASQIKAIAKFNRKFYNF